MMEWGVDECFKDGGDGMGYRYDPPSTRLLSRFAATPGRLTVLTTALLHFLFLFRRLSILLLSLYAASLLHSPAISHVPRATALYVYRCIYGRGFFFCIYTLGDSTPHSLFKVLFTCHVRHCEFNALG